MSRAHGIIRPTKVIPVKSLRFHSEGYPTLQNLSWVDPDSCFAQLVDLLIDRLTAVRGVDAIFYGFIDGLDSPRTSKAPK